MQAQLSPEQQAQDRALAAATGTHHSTARACGDLEGHTLQYAGIRPVPGRQRHHTTAWVSSQKKACVLLQITWRSPAEEANTG